MHLGLAGRELRQNAAESQRVLAERRAHPVVTRGRRVAFVEDEVDDAEHRRKPRRELGAARHLERHLRLRERALRAHDALRDRRLGHEKRARDLIGGEAAEQAQCQRDLRVGGQHGMARGEDEPQQIVADVVIDARRRDRERPTPAASSSSWPSCSCLRSSSFWRRSEIDRAMLRGGHEPCAGIIGNARLGPLLERDHERILREVLGQADVAHDAREPGDHLRRLDSPDGIDRAVRIRKRHGLQSDEANTRPCKP